MPVIACIKMSTSDEKNEQCYLCGFYELISCYTH